MRQPGGPERLCPRCQSREFRRGFSMVTGYWAGQLIVPVICSRCYYNVGFGLESALPRFEPPSGGTAQAAGRVHSPGTTFVEGRGRVWGEGRGAARVRLGALRDWVVLGVAAAIVIVIFLGYRAIGAG